MKKRFTACLVVLFMLISMLPVVAVKTKTAEAAGTIYIEGIGMLEVLYSGDSGYRITLDANKNLVITGEYFTDSGATLSYHTSVLYFATRDSGTNPGSLTDSECFPVSVYYHETEISGSKSYDTYTVSRAKLEEMIRTLYGEDGLKTSHTVYVSEGFQLKKRDSASDNTWDVYGDVYSSLSEIRKAASWSDTTYANFANYYDIQITLKLVKYSITVEAGEGGTVGQSHYEAYEGDDVTIDAYPDDEHNFSGWTVVSGPIPGFNSGSATSTFSMPNCDVVIKADFIPKEKPPATKAPVATPTPGPTPTQGPTPTPAPTPKPTYMPTENSEEIRKSVRYYSTDAGYSIGGIYDKTITPQDDAFGYIAINGSGNMTQTFSSNDFTSKGYYTYYVGTDSDGNTWYFMADGTKATYVHPKVYKGYAVDSADVRYITELTFPEKITYNGTTYTVTSIGGGTDQYRESGTYWEGSALFREWSPSYNSQEEYISETYSGTGLRQYTNQVLYGRKLGVIGNGSIWSAYFLHMFYSNSTNEHYEFENSYYVYNTTLKYITIPSTVTKIENYAFSGCQALVKIMGGANVTDIGDNAFDAIGTQTLKKSSVEHYNDGSVHNYEYYYYNGSFTFGTWTETMQSWKNKVVLSSYLELPAFGSLKNIGVSSFELRKNLFDVKLPSSVVEIGANAFKGCALDRITVPSKDTKIGDWVRLSRSDRANTTPEQTLGTKGKNAASKTLIVTELNAKAMDYGMTYEDYYDVRAGYNIIYHNNFMPSETYTTKPRVVKNYTTFKERLPLVGMSCIFSNPDLPNERYYSKEVLLGTDGALYLAEGYQIPVRQMPELTFSNIYMFELKSGYAYTTYTYVDGYVYESTTDNSVSNYCCLAFADNGKVFLYQITTGTWTDMGISAMEGNANFVFHKNAFGSGGQSGSQSEDTLDLYYINQNGGLSKKTIYTYTETISNSQGSSSTQYAYTLYDTSATDVALPSGVSEIRRFCFANEKTNNPTGYPPEINIEDANGKYWMSSFGYWYSGSSYGDYTIGYMEYQEEQAIYADRLITDFGPRMVGYNQYEKIYDLMFDPLGREFLGWTLRADGSGVLYSPGQELRITGQTNLYAKWAGAPSKKIEYIPNGGVGTMEDDVYPVDEPNPVTLKKNSYIRRGYEFAGWSYKAEPEAGDKIYADEDAIVLSAGTTRLYAQWKPVTYTVRVGNEDVRVTDQFFREYILGLDDELLLGTQADKSMTISYDLNDRETQLSMNAKAEFLSEITEQNTKAFLEFFGWRLYEDVNKDAKITTEDRYVGYYGIGAVLKNLATEKDAVFYVFPYWGGNASYVQLPEIACDGYVFLGYTPGTAYEPDYFDSAELYGPAIQEEILIPAPIGSGARYQPKKDGEILYAYYEREKQNGQICGFEVYDIFGNPAWEELEGIEYSYTIGLREENQEIWDTLPLRTGVHPLYCNLGGLPLGGGFSFRVVSTGNFAKEGTKLTIRAYFCPIGDEGYYDADVYFEQETDQGNFFKKWSAEEQTMVLHANQDSIMGADLLSRIWCGTFRMPDYLWIVETNENVSDYQQQFGLSFEEEFWMKEVRLMLCFSLCVENENGECLYYGMIPEEAEENLWVQEAGEIFREDYDKNQYVIYGGEVAVIYPGDSADKWKSIHGIY